jgi:hypothetical protein
VWQSISSQPVQAWPLAVCDASSVAQQDLVERISPENNNVIFNLLPSEKHQWYFYDMMQPGEMLVFRQYDSSETCTSRFTPHTSFNIAAARGIKSDTLPVRESVETRVLCVFDDKYGTFAGRLANAAQKNGTLAASRISSSL